ncbi:hypothetical protein MACJ_004178 (apicoplast) [Theileria orientalis]|uniref:Uncharacterized protein n=1 Tax=Theileria orientalis TaxID=68886 RepID=A0A976SK14_THEOR|nr:hypothetical protein MACJ_004178 [Theileria orientalis]
MNIVLEKIILLLSSLGRKVINLYIYHFNCCVEVLKYLILKLYGEEALERVIWQWYFAIDFYKTLWFVIKKKLIDHLDTLKLVLIWKIKRSSNYFVKCLCKYLSKYPWFNNNNIKF